MASDLQSLLVFVDGELATITSTGRCGRPSHVDNGVHICGIHDNNQRLVGIDLSPFYPAHLVLYIFLLPFDDDNIPNDVITGQFRCFLVAPQLTQMTFFMHKHDLIAN